MHSAFRRCWRSAWEPSYSRKTAVRLSSGTALITRVPPKSAPREVPTPLVFVSASSWNESSSKGVNHLSSMLSEKGFTCLQSNLDIPASSRTESTKMMQHFDAELTSAIRLSMIPFPPVIFARSAACIIAQTYISSHPASGLVLMSPPISNADVEDSLLPTKLQEFNFEPKFPIAIMGTPDEIHRLRKSNRLCQDPGVDIITVDDLEGQQAFLKIEEWLDQLGI